MDRRQEIRREAERTLHYAAQALIMAALAATEESAGPAEMGNLRGIAGRFKAARQALEEDRS